MRSHPQQQPSLNGVAIEKALSRDPLLTKAHYALIEFNFTNDSDWAGAEREFRGALELNPNRAGLHDAFATYLNATGSFDEATSNSALAEAVVSQTSHAECRRAANSR
jgi:Tfp pilus assembly protein PilF